MPRPLTLPLGLQSLVERIATTVLQPSGSSAVDFTRPTGEPALAGPDSISWQVFRNPVSLFIGGVAAVILELGEPRVRSGVWEHSSFRTDPVDRLKRTGLAAMLTVYGARSEAEKMIAGVRRAHDRVSGVTPTGQAYRANDPELLSWVQATAQFGFLEAYTRYVRPLPRADRDRFHAEGRPAALLYGSVDTPASEAELRSLFAAVAPRLEGSPVIMEFLELMRTAPLVPAALRPVQRLLVRGAIALVPDGLRPQLDLGARWNLRFGEEALIRSLARLADRIRLDSSPAAQACVRMALAPDYLHRAGR
ncbi:MAG: hypothetical protein AVDCRST_MAG23-1609 [uncultured Sphingosinicella sp.]|uniref:ER-bound oxygenase mpaB/mpaB'/Rubber oxygenase catalytic domain-containing protein n=1 Tax=uncultured Sphingosinicella sp. TaxID=478748 RepID=A0A6J4U100_9SPHN|nr:oxygenase MpaB family protein [uncultured Sphingosinicella sp.]CAA9537901.1 MAG: hypothetical protein AVDCRST_MAG23-1609 [uncultured Sphingosinicella sp.]